MLINLYPYGLVQNPFPSSPTPTLEDAKILGGSRHQDARNAIFSCVYGLTDSDLLDNSNDKFRVITIVQDVGSGKTHLTLHIKISDINNQSIISYVDLSQIYPKIMPSIYQSMIRGFQEDYISDLKKELLYYIRDTADSKLAKKIFKLGFFESVSGKGIDNKIIQILENKLQPDISSIDQIFQNEFSENNLKVIKSIIENRLDLYESITLLDMINCLSTLSRINLKLLNRISIFQLDEFDDDEETMSFIKALINIHLPYTVLMLILTPSSYNKIALKDRSVFDRLEKANYKIDLAGSNSFEEISDIVLEYIRFYSDSNNIKWEEQRDLLSKLRILYDDFDFRNIRSILNIMYHTFEVAIQKNLTVITEQILDEGIRSTYPGLRIRGSIMDIPISDYIKLKNYVNSSKNLDLDIAEAIKEVINCMHQSGIVCNHEGNKSLYDELSIVYKDVNGLTSKMAMTVTNSGSLDFQNIETYHDATLIQNSVTDHSGGISDIDNKSSIHLDRHKIIDLLYFSNKSKNNFNSNEDNKRAASLAKSINLC